MKPTWSTVSPLVARQNREGRLVVVSFACPVTGQRVSSSASMASSRSKALAGQVQRQAGHAVRQSVAGYVGGLLGGGVMGSLARRAAWEASRPAVGTAAGQQVFSEQDEQDAVVAAFEAVRGNFRWDAGRGGWVHASANPSSNPSLPPPPPPFPAAPTSAAPAPTQAASPPAPSPAARPASAAPPAMPRATDPDAPPLAAAFAGLSADDADHAELIARVLATLALADGDLGPAELDLAAAFDLDEQGLRALAASPPAEAALRALPTDLKEPVYLLALATSWADGSQRHEETSRLDTLRAALGIDRVRGSVLDRLAREHALDLALDAAYDQIAEQGGEPPATSREIRGLLARLSLTPAQLAAADARVQRRKGL